MGGVLLALAAAALLVAAGLRAAARLLPESDRIDWCVAGIIFAFAFLTTSTIVLSSAGWIGRSGFLAATAAAFVLCFLFVRPRAVRPTNDGQRTDQILTRWLVVLTFFAVGLSSTLWLWRGVGSPVLVVSDGPIYHLPFAVRWLQDGSLSRTSTPFGELAATYFPGNGEIWLCWLLALVGDDRLAKVGQWFFLAPTGLALYALARRVGDDVSAFWPAFCWPAGSLVLISSIKPDVDLPMTFLLVSGLVFIERGWSVPETENRRRCLCVAALALGSAAGTKSIGLLYAGVPMLLVLLLLRRDLKGAVSAIVAALISGGFWYLRNAFETGNPLYPLRLSLGGFVLFDGWYGAEVMRQTSAYHMPVSNWSMAWNSLLAVILQPTLWFALGISVAAGIISLFALRSTESRRALGLCLCLGIIWAAEYWFVQPYNTQQRFVLPALAILFIPTALFCGMWGIVPASLIVFASLNDWRLMPRFDWRLGAGIFLLLGATSIAAWKPKLLRSALSVALLGVCLLAPTIAEPRATAPLPLFDSTNDFGQRLFPAWARLEHAIQTNADRSVVGYAGTNLPYYLVGPGLKNRVRYVNVQGDAAWLPHDHFKEFRRRGTTDIPDGAFPQWHRDHPSKEVWLRNLEALGVNYFLVARENFHGRPDAPLGLAPFPIEYDWLISMPDRFERLGPSANPDGEEAWGIAFRVRQPAGRPK